MLLCLVDALLIVSVQGGKLTEAPAGIDTTATRAVVRVAATARGPCDGVWLMPAVATAVVRRSRGKTRRADGSLTFRGTVV
jgi:hypothetical protein